VPVQQLARLGLRQVALAERLAAGGDLFAQGVVDPARGY